MAHTTDPSVAQLHRAVLGTNPHYPRPTSATFVGPQDITVLPGGTEAGVRFTVDGYSSDWAFGPAPFPRPAAGMVPPEGTKGVAHASADGTQWWIHALFNWPGAPASPYDPTAPEAR